MEAREDAEALQCTGNPTQTPWPRRRDPALNKAHVALLSHYPICTCLDWGVNWPSVVCPCFNTAFSPYGISCKQSARAPTSSQHDVLSPDSKLTFPQPCTWAHSCAGEGGLGWVAVWSQVQEHCFRSGHRTGTLGFRAARPCTQLILDCSDAYMCTQVVQPLLLCCVLTKTKAQHLKDTGPDAWASFT